MGTLSAFYMMPHPPIVLPEVGRGEEDKIKETSSACLKIADEISILKPDTIIIITPHGPVFSDAVALSDGENISGNLAKFGARQVELKLDIDVSLIKKIVEHSKEENIVTVKITKSSASRYGIQYALDHGAIVPLYFINKKFSNYKIVHITYGMLSKMQLYQFGMSIKKAVEESETNAVLIASGDLSHCLSEGGPYEYSPYGEKFDKEIISLLQKGDVVGVFNIDQTTVEHAAECGLRSYYIMLGAMNDYDIKGNLLSYQSTFGVGYPVMSFSVERSSYNTYQQLIEEKKKIYKQKIESANPYVKLARESLTYFLMYKKYIHMPSYITDEMKNSKRGVFVSIKKEGQLRGCIGTIFPTTENVAMEIIRNAVEAGENDPRFHRVEQEELEELDFSVDVLTEPKLTSKGELDPKKYGIVVRSGNKSGLLLPDLEGVDTVEKQISIALQKAGIPSNEEYTIEKFEVIRYTDN